MTHTLPLGLAKDDGVTPSGRRSRGSSSAAGFSYFRRHRLVACLRTPVSLLLSLSLKLTTCPRKLSLSCLHHVSRATLSPDRGGAGRAFNSGTMCLQHFGANNSLLPRRSVRNHGRLRSPGFPCWPFWRAAGMPAGVPHAEARNTQAGDECQRRG